MSDNNKQSWIGYWPFILAAPLGLMLVKTVPKTDWFKDLEKHSEIKVAINIDAQLADKDLVLHIKDSSRYSFKDLAIKCDYEGASGTKLGENEFTIYRVFFSGGKQTIRNLSGSKVPDQTYHVSCIPIDFIEISGEEEKQLEKRLLDEIFEVTPNKSSNLTGAENAPAS